MKKLISKIYKSTSWVYLSNEYISINGKNRDMSKIRKALIYLSYFLYNTLKNFLIILSITFIFLLVDLDVVKNLSETSGMGMVKSFFMISLLLGGGITLFNAFLSIVIESIIALVKLFSK